MDEKTEKKWNENIERLGLETEKPKIMEQAEDYEYVCEETKNLIKKFIDKKIIPPVVAFAMTQEITRVISTIATIEVLRDGESNIVDVLSNAMKENGQPMTDIPDGLKGGITGKENLEKYKNKHNEKDAPDVMFR